MLGRAADPRQDVGDREPTERHREGLGDEPATEQESTGAEQASPREPPGQRRIAQLDGAGGEVAERGEEGDRLDTDTEVLRDLGVDQGQDERLRVVDGVGDRQEPERAHRPDDDPVGGIGKRGGGRRGRQPHRPDDAASWTSRLGHRAGQRRGRGGSRSGRRARRSRAGRRRPASGGGVRERSEPVHRRSRESAAKSGRSSSTRRRLRSRAADDVEPANPPGRRVARLGLQPSRQHATFASRPRRPAPTSSNQSQTSTTTASPLHAASRRARRRSTATSPLPGRSRARGARTSRRRGRSRRARSGGGGARCPAAGRRRARAPGTRRAARRRRRRGTPTSPGSRRSDTALDFADPRLRQLRPRPPAACCVIPWSVGRLAGRRRDGARGMRAGGLRARSSGPSARLRSSISASITGRAWLRDLARRRSRRRRLRRPTIRRSSSDVPPTASPVAEPLSGPATALATDGPISAADLRRRGTGAGDQRNGRAGPGAAERAAG